MLFSDLGKTEAVTRASCNVICHGIQIDVNVLSEKMD